MHDQPVNTDYQGEDRIRLDVFMELGMAALLILEFYIVSPVIKPCVILIIKTTNKT